MAKIIALKCPSCGANISRDTKNCEYCGTALVFQQDQSTLVASGLTLCPVCGASNPIGRWFCVNCGEVISVDERLREFQKRERFLQEQYRTSLPEDLQKRLAADEYVHYVCCESHPLNVFRYVVTDRYVRGWKQARVFSQKIDYWDLQYGDIVYLNDPKTFDSTYYYIEIGTSSKEKKILNNRGISVSWNVHNSIRDAYLNHLNHKKETRVLVCFADLDKKAGISQNVR